MGLFDRFCKPSEPVHIVDGILLDGEEDIIEITAALVPEPTNKHDPNAVQVEIDARRVGYLSREDALAYRPTLRKLAKQGKSRLAKVSLLVAVKKATAMALCSSFRIWMVKGIGRTGRAAIG